MPVLALEWRQEPMSETVLDYLVYGNHNPPYQYSDAKSGGKGIVCQIVDSIANEMRLKVHPHMEPIKAYETQHSLGLLSSLDHLWNTKLVAPARLG